MKPLRLMVSLLIGLILTGCEHAGDKTPPEISQVHSSIWHYHPTYWTKADQEVKSSLAVSVEFRVTDPDGLDDLNKIDTYDRINGTYRNRLTRYAGQGMGSSYFSDYDVFLFSFFDSSNPDRVELTNWQIVATDLKGYVGTRDFEFVLPDGEPLNDETFVYSPPAYGDAPDGVPAMEAMTVADNGLLISFDSVNNVFNIEFEVKDTRAKHYEIWFYEADHTDWRVGLAKYNTASIMATPINYEGKTLLALPWTEVNLLSSVLPSEIHGVHVVLYDEPIASELIFNGKWFNYIGISEYFTQPLPLPQPE